MAFQHFGATSSGSLLPSDVITGMVDLLSTLVEGDSLKVEYERLFSVTEHGNAQKFMGEVERRMESEGYDDSEDAQWDYERLESLIQSLLPSYCYFGSQEGDGACFGVWISWDSIEEDVYDEELTKVDEVPDEDGTYLQVSDHGNASLYVVYNGKSREVWSV